jgi:hypothetical protein
MLEVLKENKSKKPLSPIRHISEISDISRIPFERFRQPEKKQEQKMK